MNWVISLFMMILVCLCLGNSEAFGGATSTLPEARILLFDDYYVTNSPAPVWVHEGPVPVGTLSKKAILSGTNHYHRTGWRLLYCRTGTTRLIGLSVAPNVASNLTANLQNTLGAQIESPVFQEGIGTVYFEAINNLSGVLGQFTVEYATNMVSSSDPGLYYPVNSPTNGKAYVWTTLEEVYLNATVSSEFTRYQKLVNFRQPAKLRFRRTASSVDKSLDDAFIVIDNIRVSSPPANVVVYKAESPFEPGYPSVGTNLTLRCFADNADTQAPTVARTVRAIHRWRCLDQAVNGWTTNTMNRTSLGDGQGNGEKYEAVLPPQSQVGDLEYFFVCDFEGAYYQSPDYTGLGFAYGSERLPAVTLRGGASEPDGREFYTRLRPYASRFGEVQVMADQFEQPIVMALVGDDEWRGMIPVQAAGVTNLSWVFKGVKAHEPGADFFSADTLYWSDPDPSRVGSVPSRGVCKQTPESARMSQAVPACGYLQLTLNTRTLDYRSLRAEYQDFNAWVAPNESFTDGSDQDTRRSYLSTFDAWPTSADQTFNECLIGYVSTTNLFSRDPFVTPQQWVAGSAAYVAERCEADANNKPLGMSGFQNLSLRLKGGDAALGLGTVRNAVASSPDGLKQVSFKCRLGQTSSNYDIAYNRAEFMKTNYLVRANAMVFSPLSPEQPSLSLVGYYSDPEHFYEYRVTQIPDPNSALTGRDKRVNHQLWKWSGSTAVLLAENRTSTDTTLALSTMMEMRLYNSSATATTLRCKFSYVDNVLAYTDSTAPLQSGTYGFLSSEGRAGFSAVYTQPTTLDAAATGTATSVLDAYSLVNFNSQKVNWFTPSGRFSAMNTLSPYGIYSVMPTQKVGVYLQESDTVSGLEPALPGSPLWRKVQEVTVPDFGYTSVAVPVNSWKSQFVMLQVVGGPADVIVDELAATSWHGRSVSDSGLNLPTDWLATEAWVVPDASVTGRVVQLDHSRGDPSKEQAVRALASEAGLGLMEFDYRALRAPAKLTVQYARKREPLAWTEVKSFSTVTATGWTHAVAPLGMDEPGFFRVLHERGGIYSNALVEISDARVSDEPRVDSTAWKVYNARITAADLMRVPLDQSRACFLNNSQTLEADPVQELSEPFVQTPLLPAGLGELTFHARAYSNSQSAAVYVYASTNGWWAASNMWFEVSRFENITSTCYRAYSFKTALGSNYQSLRLMTKTSAGARRVCLDNVSVSEPAAPSFDIVNVRVLCAERDGAYSMSRFQPTPTDDVGIEAQLANLQFAPSNIQVFVTYFIGASVWGVDNWPLGLQVTKPLYATSEDALVYRTSTADDIPAQGLEQVVQYRVWASHGGGGAAYVERQASFENPPWYGSVDLNQTYAAQGWSPYYIVEGSLSATETTPVPVPYAWLELYPSLISRRDGDYEAAAWVDFDGDGCKTWEEYVLGTVPTNSESVFLALIDVSNAMPRVTWTPDLGVSRQYTVEGRRSLDSGGWGPTNAESRFFRVKVQLP